MYKKLAVFAMLFSVGLAMIYANRGNSLTYNSLDYIVSDEAFAPQSLIDDLKNYNGGVKNYYNLIMKIYESARMPKISDYYCDDKDGNFIKP